MFLHTKLHSKCRLWFGFALVWICPLLLPFVSSYVRTFLLSGPVNSINDWRTRVFSCQLRKTFGTELRVSAWELTASRCFQQCQGTETARSWYTQVINSVPILSSWRKRRLPMICKAVFYSAFSVTYLYCNISTTSLPYTCHILQTFSISNPLSQAYYWITCFNLY